MFKKLPLFIKAFALLGIAFCLQMNTAKAQVACPDQVFTVGVNANFDHSFEIHYLSNQFGGDMVQINASSISLDLPDGLTIDNTANIYGTPTVASSITQYTIRAYYVDMENGNTGYQDFTINITVNAAPNTWLGKSATWNDVNNWSLGVVPGQPDNIIIPANPTGGSYQPVLNLNANVNGILLDGTIQLNGYTLQFNAPITNSGIAGAFIGDAAATLSVQASSPTTINISGGAIGTLTIGNGTAVTLGAPLDIYTLLDINGSLTTNNYPLTLKSNASSTAIISPATIFNAVNGDVTVERYIPAGYKAYRELCTGGVNPSTDIFSSWQEGGSYTHPGYGTFITGEANTGLNQNGFDNNTGFDYTYAGNASVYTYNHNGLGGWHSLGYTKSGYAYLDPYAGYHTMIYGDRTSNLYSAGFDAIPNMGGTTLRTTGSLITSDVAYSTDGSGGGTNNIQNLSDDANGASFVANPYAAPLNLGDALNYYSTGLNLEYWYFDPTNVTAGVQSFAGYNFAAGSSNNPSSGLQLDSYIQPGQAFWLVSDPTYSSGNGRFIDFSHAIRGNNNLNNGVFKGGKPNRIAASIWKKDANNTLHNLDGAVAVYGAAFNKAIGKEDSRKFWNTNENITITEGTEDIAIDGLPNPVVNDEIVLNLTNLTAAKPYTLRLDAQDFASVNNVQPYLQDKFLNTLVALNADSTFVNFTTTADKASYINRFVVVFKAGSALPVEFVNIKAKHTASVNVVSWTTGEETSMLNYEVQKSNNGNEFVTIATVDAKNINNSNYTYNDASTSAKAYYRIKATANNAKVSYSHVVMLSNETKASIAAMPNPVTNGVLNLQMNNVPKGTYELALYNHLGQQVMTKAITATDDNSIQTIRLNGTATGVYTLKLLGTEYNTQLIIKN